jgi:alpha-tubulin suppressor-like RCC1 family protein
MARSPAVRRARRWTLLAVGSVLGFVVSTTGGYGTANPYSNAVQQINTGGGLTVSSVVLTGDNVGTALTETVNDMKTGDYRERVIDLTLPYDADVTYSVKADVLSDASPDLLAGVSQVGDAVDTVEATNAGLAASDASDLNAPAGQGGLFVEIYRCTGAGNAYESTNGVITSRTDDREVSCNNAGVPQGPKGNGAAITGVDPILGGVSAASAGETHTCSVRIDGALWCWGQNADGRTGRGTIWGNTNTPTQVGTDTNWQSVSSGAAHTCATKTTGTLWCWGSNTNGQTGLGTASGATLTPTQVGTDTNWQSGDAGLYHTCATKTTGTLWCWGQNANGRTGLNTTTGNTLSPTQVGAANNWQAITAGANHTCATKTDGTISCWGENTGGRTGLGITTGDTLSPTQVGTDTNWQTVSAGTQHTCARKTTGTLWCWGANGSGELGDGTTTGRTTPTQVGAASDWQSVATGMYSTCATRTSGTLWCWGANGSGQLGDGTQTNRSTPTQVGTDTNWATATTGSQFACATRVTGPIWCWGLNTNNQLGAERITPTAAGTDTNWQTYDAGSAHMCATKTTGTLWCWGANTFSQLGDGTVTSRSAPTQIGSDANWQTISAGNAHSCATKTTGTLWCWGDNWNGQLGTGDFAGRTSPTQVGSASDWQSVTAGSRHTCARKTSGTLWCWGPNGNGEVGDGTTTTRTTPTQVGTDTNWQTISAGNESTCVTKTTGTLWCWGANASGQLGDGTTTNRLAPLQVGTDTNWQTPAVAWEHTCALKTTGTIWCWGNDASGRTGLGKLWGNTWAPTQVGTDTNWQTLNATGAYVAHTCATKTSGALWCWGGNGSGQLGDGTDTERLTPIQIGTNTDWQSTTGGADHTCARKTNGTIWCWGSNNYGQFGNGRNTLAPSLARVALGGRYTTPTVVRPAGQTLRLLVRVRFADDGTPLRQNTLNGESIRLTHRFALVERAGGAV